MGKVHTQPPDYKERTDKLIDKEKYERALKLYDKAIDDNQYDYELFESRSKVKEILGDTDGAEMDHLDSGRLRNEIISVVNIRAIGVTGTEKRMVKTIRY